MSSGVSDQMKTLGNTVKSSEERNIPWSQQVDEASYENIPSPTPDDNFATNQSSMQFQYPPFNVKDNQNILWNNKSRKSNFESNNKYGKPSYNAKRDDFQTNAWGTNNSRKGVSENAPGNYNRPNNKLEDNYTSGKVDNRNNANITTEERKVSAPTVTAAPKKTTWASIASQPAKLTSRTTLTTSSHKKKGPGMPPPPMVPGKHNLDVNIWDIPNNNPPPVPSPPPPVGQVFTEVPTELSSGMSSDHDLGVRPEKGQKVADISRDENHKLSYAGNFGRVHNSPNGHSRKNWSTQHPLHQNRNVASAGGGLTRRMDGNNINSNRFNDRRPHYPVARSEHEVYENRDDNSQRNTAQTASVDEVLVETPQAVLEELRDKNNYNPAEIDLEKAAAARFFVIKSYSEDDIHRSIKYEIWCSTDHGNKRLDDAFKERQKEGGNILLFFSVNGSGHFCGMAQMMTAVDYNSISSVWAQDKWKGKFKVKWIYVKDVPNTKLRHIRLENNENKSVTHSRDTQEVPNARGIEVLQILHSYQHSTSIFDDFYHYEKKQEEEVSSKKPLTHDNMGIPQAQSPTIRHHSRQIDDRERDRDGRNVTGQKYYGGSGGGGGGGGGGGNFRDRNNSHRGGYHNNYNEHRRFESHRTNDQQQKDRGDIDGDRENNEYGSRHAPKYDYNRRDDRPLSKHNNRERDCSEDHSKSESRYRPREIQKDNEYVIADRIRGTDY